MERKYVDTDGERQSLKWKFIVCCDFVGWNKTKGRQTEKKERYRFSEKKLKGTNTYFADLSAFLFAVFIHNFTLCIYTHKYMILHRIMPFKEVWDRNFGSLISFCEF